MATYLVPKETATLINSAFSKCTNLSLILGRYADRAVVDEHKNVGPWLKTFITRFDQASAKPILDAVYARWQAMAASVPATAQFTARALGRVLVGFGGKGALDFGLTLSHVTGLPTIPGSALKGLARAYGLLTVAADLAEARNVKSPLTVPPDSAKAETLLEQLDALLAAESRSGADLRRAADALSAHFTMAPADFISALDQYGPANDYRRAFGSQEAGGACIFYDAVVVPVAKNRPLFEVDVMTPHFKDYYDDVNGARPNYNRAPHDGQNPVPIAFLTVAAGTRFAFAVGLRRVLEGDAQAAQARDQAVAWLKAGLHELGVGAKTAAGYGVFEQMS